MKYDAPLEWRKALARIWGRTELMHKYQHRPQVLSDWREVNRQVERMRK